MSERPYWVSIADPLSVELYEYWGSDVLMIACLERELEKAYKAGVEKGKELSGERQALRGSITQDFTVLVSCDGKEQRVWGAREKKVDCSGAYLYALFGVRPEKQLWRHVEGGVELRDSFPIPDRDDAMFVVHDGDKFHSTWREINGN